MTSRLESLIEAMGLAAQDLRQDLSGVPTICTDNDTDGLAAGLILHEALSRMGFRGIKRYCVTQPYQMMLDKVFREAKGPVLFADLGANDVDEIVETRRSEGNTSPLVIIEHHEHDTHPENIHYLNSVAFGISGDAEVCSSTMAYLFAKTINPTNTDLAYLGVLGAINDHNHTNEDNEGRLIYIDHIAFTDATFEGLKQSLPVSHPQIWTALHEAYAVEEIRRHIDESDDELIEEIKIALGKGRRLESELHIGRVLAALPKEASDQLARQLALGLGHAKYDDHNERYSVSLPGRSGWEGAEKIKNNVNILGTQQYHDKPWSIARRLLRGVEAETLRSEISRLRRKQTNMFDEAKEIAKAKMRHGDYIQWFDVGDLFVQTSAKSIGLFCNEVLKSADIPVNRNKYLFGSQNLGPVPQVGDWPQPTSKISIRVPQTLRDLIKEEKLPEVGDIIRHLSTEVKTHSSQSHRYRGAVSLPTAHLGEAFASIEAYIEEFEADDRSFDYNPTDSWSTADQ